MSRSQYTSRNERYIVRAQEPIVSYEQVLLLQISKCGSAPHIEYPLCVDNLISMLPAALATKVNVFYQEIIDIIRSHIDQKRIECCKEYIDKYEFCLCTTDDAIPIANKIIKDIIEEQPDLMKFKHVLYPVVLHTLKHDHPQPATILNKLKFAIATQLLLESGILAPRSGHIYVGRVED